jgi:hypothetical protein
LSDLLGTWADRLHRELHAQVRAFPTVQAAVLWYAVQRKRKESAGGNLGCGGGAQSAEAINQSHATYARLAACMVAVDEVDDLTSRHGTLARIAGGALEARATEAVLSNLISWYVSSAERGQQRLADELEMSPYKLSQIMGRIEQVLWRRMVSRHLLPGLHEAAALGVFLRWGAEREPPCPRSMTLCVG